MGEPLISLRGSRSLTIALRPLKPLYTHVLNALAQSDSCISALPRTPIVKIGRRHCEACAYLWDCIAQLVKKGLAKRVGRGKFVKL